MNQQSNRLKDISLVTANFGNSLIFKDVLLDWFCFLGGRPGEVVVVDCGSDTKTHSMYWQLYQEGWIDSLQVIHPNHEDSYGGKETSYIQKYTAASIASKPYLLWFQSDTLPYRQGHNTWLEESFSYLDQNNVCAISGSFNLPSKHHDAWFGWYFSNRCSLNFALMKKSTFMNAVHEFADAYITAGFKGVNPAEATGQSKYLLEVALEQYMKRHNLYTLCKIEDLNWTVFHTNLHEERLQQTRDKYLAREDIERFMNVGFSDAKRIPDNAIYYGQVLASIIKKLQLAFEKSSIARH